MLLPQNVRLIKGHLHRRNNNSNTKFGRNIVDKPRKPNYTQHTEQRINIENSNLNKLCRKVSHFTQVKLLKRERVRGRERERERESEN